jgi:transketolase
MGAAAIRVALWKYVMKFHPQHPEFVNRDRFVLSNGPHSFASILLHAFERLS